MIFAFTLLICWSLSNRNQLPLYARFLNCVEKYVGRKIFSREIPSNLFLNDKKNSQTIYNQLSPQITSNSIFLSVIIWTKSCMCGQSVQNLIHIYVFKDFTVLTVYSSNFHVEVCIILLFALIVMLTFYPLTCSYIKRTLQKQSYKLLLKQDLFEILTSLIHRKD